MEIDTKKYWAAVAVAIKMEMVAAGLSQGSLATQVGIGRDTLNRYLAGKVEMPFNIFVAISGALGVSPQKLFDIADSRLNQGK